MWESPLRAWCQLDNHSEYNTVKGILIQYAKFWMGEMFISSQGTKNRLDNSRPMEWRRSEPLFSRKPLLMSPYFTEKSHQYRSWGFPGSSVVKEPACQCGRHRFNTWSEKIPHAEEQQRPDATTVEAGLWTWGTATPEPRCQNYWSSCSAAKEATTLRSHSTDRSK